MSETSLNRQTGAAVRNCKHHIGHTGPLTGLGRALGIWAAPGLLVPAGEAQRQQAQTELINAGHGRHRILLLWSEQHSANQRRAACARTIYEREREL